MSYFPGENNSPNAPGNLPDEHRKYEVLRIGSQSLFALYLYKNP